MCVFFFFFTRFDRVGQAYQKPFHMDNLCIVTFQIFLVFYIAINFSNVNRKCWDWMWSPVFVLFLFAAWMLCTALVDFIIMNFDLEQKKYHKHFFLIKWFNFVQFLNRSWLYHVINRIHSRRSSFFFNWPRHFLMILLHIFEYFPLFFTALLIFLSSFPSENHRKNNI